MSTSMRFKFLSGDMNWQTYGGKFISSVQNNGDFDYWVIMDVINWNEYEHNPKVNYNVSLSVVAPSQVPQKELDSAISSCGMSDEQIDDLEKTNDKTLLVEILSDYGTSAPIANFDGNNLRKLMKQAREEAFIATRLLGFYLDRQVNMIGATGWDALEGNLLGSLKNEFVE